jgi:transcriptional regulator with XRE-family HTH domain
MLRWREYRHLTLQDVADTVGMSRQGVNYIEQGKNSLSVAKLNIICRKAFKIDLATFFGPLPKKAAA